MLEKNCLDYQVRLTSIEFVMEVVILPVRDWRIRSEAFTWWREDYRREDWKREKNENRNRRER